MVTKYNTGDKVLIEATIQEAFQIHNSREIYYRIKECDTVVGEDCIKAGPVHVKVTADMEAVEAEIKKAEQLRDILEQAMDLANSIAHKDLIIRLCTIVDGKPAELASITTEG